MKRIKAIISNKNGQWEEEYTVKDDIEPRKYFEDLIHNFNITLRPGEMPRKLARVFDVEEVVDFKGMSDNELVRKYLEYKRFQSAVLGKAINDEIARDSARYLHNAFLYDALQRMYYVLDDFTSIMWDDRFRWVIIEMRRRGWKQLKRRINRVLSEDD